MTQNSKTDRVVHTAKVGGELTMAMSAICEEVFHGLSLAVLVFDRRLRIVVRNQTAESLFGAGAEMLSDVLASTTIEGRYADWATDLREMMESRRERRFDGVTFASDQTGERLLDLIGAPLVDPGNQQVVGGILVVEDVTGRASMERRLAVSERLAAVGKLAAKVAHELNNPLDGMLRYINLSIRVAAENGQDQIVEYLNRARTGLMRMVQITRELLEFSRSPTIELKDTDINRVVEDALTAMEDKAIANKVIIAAAFHEQAPRLRDSTNIFQVFCNLIKNAIDAMPDGGTLSVSTRIADRHVVVTFEDTGVGLPDDIEKVFEPFFSTKGPGKGTGLGLAICRDIVEKYNGQITAGRRESVGSVFTVRIPLDSCSRGIPGARWRSPEPR